MNEQFYENVEIIYKRGCDGSNGQSQYKQKYYNDPNILCPDKDLFLFSINPLQLHSFNKQNNNNLEK